MLAANATPSSSAPQTAAAQPAAKPAAAQPVPALKSLRRYYVIGLSSILALFGGLGSWIAVAEISGGVIAPGSIAVEGYAKKVQHLEGGIVASIAVKNADVVQAGQPLLRLDDTDVRAQLLITQSQLAEMKARQARLIAERDGKEKFDAAPKADWPASVLEVWQGQERLFYARLEARTGKEKQQNERILQLEEVVRGLQSQRAAKERQLELIGDELTGLIELADKQLVVKSRVLALQREQAKVEGERGQFVAEVAKTNVQISETKLQIAEQRQTFLSEVLSELRDVDTKLAELSEREVATSSKLKRLNVIAPQSGVVHKLTVHTVGGVIAPGETVMEIVPQEEKLVVDGQLDPMFVEQVKAGQGVLLRLTAFDHQSTPELEGTVQAVSADVRQDSPQTPRYYAVRVTINDGETHKLNGGRLVPGMPAEMIIKRLDRTVLSYLAKPVMDQLSHAFRER